jgi:hypothetical protein
MKSPIELRGIEGHIILYLKNRYSVPDVGLLEGLRKIWAIRCGYDYDEKDKSSDEYIANELWRIFKLTMPDKIDFFMNIIHREINSTWRFDTVIPLERLIYIYCSELSGLTVREKIGEKYHTLIILPKPKKRVFKRILRGNGRYKDYELIAK